MDPTAKLLIAIGVGFIVIGAAWQFGWIQALRLGRLPGDILIEKDNMKVYFPITTGLLISLVFSAILWLFKRS